MHKLIMAASLIFCSLTTLCIAQNESLLIGPGDLIQVDVIDTPELEQQVRVTDSGTITLAYLGTVRIAGETPSGASEHIQNMLIAKEVMRHPQVNIRVQEYATQDVSIMGQVKTPGTYSITTPQTILKVLSMAGGLTDVADRQVVVKRHNSSEESSYYVSNDAKQALSDMVMVNPGDIVLVAKAPIIYIMGDVNRPGGYAISTNDSHLTVLQAIALAGSGNKTAVKSHVRLIRTTAQGQTETTPIHLDAIEKGKLADIPLQPNDVIFVPFSWLKNAAMSSGQIAASTAGAAVYLVP
jgi:polysaccharide export outer membrane protein